jgi:hypothetical protein
MAIDQVLNNVMQREHASRDAKNAYKVFMAKKLSWAKKPKVVRRQPDWQTRKLRMLRHHR